MTVEDRADRLMRRRYGYVARNTLTWASLRLDVAWAVMVRPLARALIRWRPPWQSRPGPGG